MCAAKLIHRSLPSCVALLLLATLSMLATVSPTNAAPVTLRFEATVDSIVMTPLFDSGVQVNVGDKVSGKFTFEPQTGDGGELQVVQPFAAFLIVDGEILGTPQSIADLTITTLDDTGIVDFPPALAIDQIEVFSTIGPTEGGSLPNVDGTRSLLRMTIRGPVSILLNPSFPAEHTTWNEFQFQRTLGVGIRGVNGETLGFFATVGDMTVVPEPATATSTVVVAGLLAANLRRVLGMFPIRNSQ